MIYCQSVSSCFLFCHCGSQSRTQLWQPRSWAVEGGEKRQEDIQSTAADSLELRQSICLFTKLSSLAHLDNTVNSNQDPVISNYRPWAAGEAGCDEVRHASINLLTTFALMKDFHGGAPGLLEQRARQTTRPHTGNYPSNHWGHVVYYYMWFTALNLC